MKKAQFRFMLLIGVFFVSILSLSAQAEKSYHQSLPIDDASKIVVQVADNIEIIPWMGNTILVETKVQLTNASVDILNYIVKQGRYDVAIEKEGTLMRIVSKNPTRAPIRIKNVDCFETVTVKIFVPEEFKAVKVNELEMK